MESRCASASTHSSVMETTARCSFCFLKWNVAMVWRVIQLGHGRLGPCFFMPTGCFMFRGEEGASGSSLREQTSGRKGTSRTCRPSHPRNCLRLQCCPIANRHISCLSGLGKGFMKPKCVFQIRHKGGCKISWARSLAGRTSPSHSSCWRKRRRSPVRIRAGPLLFGYRTNTLTHRMLACCWILGVDAHLLDHVGVQVHSNHMVNWN